MKIYKENEEIVIRIPIWQNSFDAIGEVCGSVHNVVGVIIHKKDNEVSFENGIYQLIDMDYKDKSPQLGMPIIMLYIKDAEIQKLCSELGIQVWEYESCDKCGDTLFGSHTMDSDGKYICFKCEK